MDHFYSLTLMVLIVLMLVAVLNDIRTRRIPNRLILVGLALGTTFQLVGVDHIMDGDFFMLAFGANGIKAALLGGLSGLALFLPFYVLRTFGAGDVKLLATVGVFLGPQHVMYAALWTMIAGGTLSLVWALCTGVLRQVFSNLHSMCITALMNAQTGGSASIPAPVQTTGRLPYAIAIACGAAIEIFRTLHV